MAGLSKAIAFTAVALLATATTALGQTEPAGWRNSETDGQVQAFVSAQMGEGASAATVYLGFFCGARPAVRLRGPVAGVRPGGKAEPVSIAFEAGDDLFVTSLDASFGAAGPERAELVAERGVIEAADVDTLRDLATFLREATGSEFSLRSAAPPLAFKLSLEGAKAALSRYLGACTALARQ
ncbi:hypothetical protein [Phreatobacter stygius]|uniref:Uncharacterized protein n=1 Tax=Phreatobacter stygius TaxID=1940610 RepID=A0A4D7B859_9HYPH|nr:hypothetical protein [Phreatobacter stygius]QCI66488.1 hypothetical protein E8M01_21005 [Phreatobacter stygius]